MQCALMRVSLGQVKVSRSHFLPLAPDRRAGKRLGAQATEVARATPGDESRIDELIYLLKFSGCVLCVCVCVFVCVCAVKVNCPNVWCTVLGIQEMHTKYVIIGSLVRR